MHKSYFIIPLFLAIVRYFLLRDNYILPGSELRYLLVRSNYAPKYNTITVRVGVLIFGLFFF